MKISSIALKRLIKCATLLKYGEQLKSASWKVQMRTHSPNANLVKNVCTIIKLIVGKKVYSTKTILLLNSQDITFFISLYAKSFVESMSRRWQLIIGGQ